MALMKEKFMVNYAANKAYQTHIKGNRLIERGKPDAAQPLFDSALGLYEKAFAMGCDRAGILMSYSVLLMRYGRHAEARDIMLRVDARSDLAPSDRRQLRVNYGLCMWKLGELEKAIAAMKQAAEPVKTTMIYTTLGLLLIERAIATGDFDEAIAFNREAYEYDEDDGDTLDNLGQLHLALSRRAKAQGDAEQAASNWKAAGEYFVRALERKPSLVTAMYYRAAMLREDGDEQGALKLLNAALEGQFTPLCPIAREQVAAALQQ